MKTNIDYYKRDSDSHNHPKFKLLRSYYKTPDEGWAAEGRFWALNDIIAKSENCILDLSKRRNIGIYANELNMSIEDFLKFIELLCSEDIELLIKLDNDKYTTDRVQEIYQELYRERQKATLRYYKKFSGENQEFSGEVSQFSGENSKTSAIIENNNNKNLTKNDYTNNCLIDINQDKKDVKITTSGENSKTSGENCQFSGEVGYIKEYNIIYNNIKKEKEKYIKRKRKKDKNEIQNSVDSIYKIFEQELNTDLDTIETLRTIWIKNFARNPALPELTFVKELVSKFGKEKADRILHTLRVNNFHSIAKMKNVISDDGSIALNCKNEYTWDELLNLANKMTAEERKSYLARFVKNEKGLYVEKSQFNDTS